MNRVSIVTDSVACLPKNLINKYEINVIPVNLIMENNSYRDGIDITPDEVYKRLPQLKTLPTTSTPSPGQFIEVFNRLKNKTNEILCITVSSKLSAIFNSAIQAKDIFQQTNKDTAISVFDCMTAAGAEGFVALEAARCAQAGEPLSKVTETAERMKLKVHMIAMLDTLHYLAKGGRVPQAASWMCSFFQIKPLLQIIPTQGEVSLMGKPRTRKRGIEKLLTILKEHTGNNRLHINIQHTVCREEAEQVKDRIKSEFNCAEIFITDFTPVMGAHTGTGVLCFSFFSE